MCRDSFSFGGGVVNKCLWFRKWVEDNTVKASRVSYYAPAKKKKKKKSVTVREKCSPILLVLILGSLSLFFGVKAVFLEVFPYSFGVKEIFF